MRFIVRPPASAMRRADTGGPGEGDHVDVAGVDERLRRCPAWSR